MNEPAGNSQFAPRGAAVPAAGSDSVPLSRPDQGGRPPAPAGEGARPTQNETAIPVRSRRQAMDWSLVLASQHLETRIVCEEGRWSLRVAAHDSRRAFEALRRYVQENRRWRWQDALLPPFQFHWGSALWALSLVWIDWIGPPAWRQAACVDANAVSAGQWWRLFTAIGLHKDAAHLAGNAAFGFLLLGLAMAQWGAGAALLFSFLAGAGGNLVAWLGYRGEYQSLGASGMVMGALGLAAAHAASFWRKQRLPAHAALRAAVAGALLFILLGLDPSADVLAHLGGFLFGAAFGALLIVLPERVWRRPVAQRTWGLAFGALAGATFLLSITHAR